MIPSHDVLIMTRAGNKKLQEKSRENGITNQNLATKENAATQAKLDHLHIWEATSISDVNHLIKVQFELKAKLKYNENANIVMHNNKIVVEYSDKSLTTIELILRKLVFVVKQQEIEKLAVSIADKIFNKISMQNFKQTWNKIQSHRKKGIKIILYKPPKEIKSTIQMKKLISKFHDEELGGHIGISRCIKKLRQHYVWKNMSKMVKEYVNNCKLCNEIKITKYTKEPMTLTDTPNTAFETITVDTVGPLRPSNGHRYILTMQCELTKYIAAYPMETKDAVTVAKTIVEGFILKYGCFKTIKTDKGTEFTNELLKNICRLLKIEKRVSAPFHHETVGTVERNHRVLNEYLRALQKDDNWEQLLPYYVYCYNTTPNCSTNYTPHELIFGKISSLPCEVFDSKNKRTYENDSKNAEKKTT